MSQLILIIHVLVAIAIIVLILLQHGKGADAGAAFGSGASNTMFGSMGSMPFLMKITALLAAVFFATSITLSYFSSHFESKESNNIFNIPQQPATQPSSAAPVNTNSNQQSKLPPVQSKKPAAKTESLKVKTDNQQHILKEHKSPVNVPAQGGSS